MPSFSTCGAAGIGLQGIFGRRGVDRDRIATGEATEASIPLPCRTQEPVETEIAEGIGPEMAANLLQIAAMGDQTLALSHVDPEVAGVGDRRRRDAEVDRRGAAPPQQVDDLRHRVAADDAVVDDHHPLVLHRSSQWVELEPDSGLTRVLVGLDKGAADVAVLHQPLAQGQAHLLGVADGRRHSGIRDPDDQVRLRRVLFGQLAAHRHPRLEGRLTVEHAVRPGEVDLLEDAQRRSRRVLHQVGAESGIVEPEDLARLHIAHQFRPDGIERAALGGDQPMVVSPAEAQAGAGRADRGPRKARRW